jgi:SAM-dependent methyltransferase
MARNVNYRTGIYGANVTGRDKPLAPASLGGLGLRAHHLRKLIRKHFPPETDAAILDLGCGHGALLHFARTEGYTNIRGVDGSPEQLEAAGALGIEGVEQVDVMEALAKLPDKSLDCVVSFDLIEHFNRNELLALVDEVHRILRPEGRWIIHTPNAESPFGMRMLYWDFTHEIAFTRTSIAQLLLSSGFSDVDCFEDTPVPHGARSLARWVIWKCLRVFLRLYLAAETGNVDRNAVLSQNLLAVALK